MTITIDRAGRVLIPKDIRDRLNLFTGAELEIELLGDGVKLCPPSQESKLVGKRGVLVFDGGSDSEVDIVDFINSERVRRAGFSGV